MNRRLRDTDPRKRNRAFLVAALAGCLLIGDVANTRLILANLLTSIVSASSTEQ